MIKLVIATNKKIDIMIKAHYGLKKDINLIIKKNIS